MLEQQPLNLVVLVVLVVYVMEEQVFVVDLAGKVVFVEQLDAKELEGEIVGVFVLVVELAEKVVSVELDIEEVG